MQTISDLLTPLTAAQMRAAMVKVMVQCGVRADQWRPGGTFSTMLTVVSSQFANFQQLLVDAIGGGFLTVATEGWLTLLAYFVYGVTRPSATFASGPVTLTNTGGGVYSYSPGQATFLDSSSGATYVNTQAIALGALSQQTVTVQATEAGTPSNAPPAAIDTLVTVMLGVTVSNAIAVVGSDALSDVGLVALCQAKLGSLSVRGPTGAYQWAVFTAVNASGAPVNINRVTVSPASHTGLVTIWSASPTGTPTAADLLAAQASVVANAQPLGVTATVVGVTAVVYNNAIVVWARAAPGLSAASLQTAAENAIDNLLATYPIGGLSTDTFTGLFGAAIEIAVGSSSPAIFDVTLSSTAPAGGQTGDLALLPGQVAVNATSLTVRLV